MADAQGWKPAGKTAAICLTIDDVHPTLPIDGHDVGDLARRGLGHWAWLASRHPRLRATLFVTPDWQSLTHFPPPAGQDARKRRLDPGTLRIDRHPAFVEYLRGLPQVEFALHGLTHLGLEDGSLAEFQGRSRAECRRMLEESWRLMRTAGLPIVAGLTPPAWEAPDELLRAMVDLNLSFIASARDLTTPIAPSATTNGSGLRGVSLIYPERLPHGPLVHLTSNVQGISDIGRAMAILDAGGLLAVKAHVIKRVGAYEALDGLDESYVRFLDALLIAAGDRYGDQLWWTTMSAIADGLRS